MVTGTVYTQKQWQLHALLGHLAFLTSHPINPGHSSNNTHTEQSADSKVGPRVCASCQSALLPVTSSLVSSAFTAPSAKWGHTRSSCCSLSICSPGNNCWLSNFKTSHRSPGKGLHQDKYKGLSSGPQHPCKSWARQCTSITPALRKRTQHRQIPGTLWLPV